MRRRGALSMNIEASVCSLYLLSTPSLLKVLSFNFDWQRHKISSVDWQSQKQTIQNTSDVISIVEVLHFTALVLIWSLARLGVTCWAPWLFTHQTFSRVLMFGHLTPYTSHLTPPPTTSTNIQEPRLTSIWQTTLEIVPCPVTRWVAPLVPGIACVTARLCLTINTKICSLLQDLHIYPIIVSYHKFPWETQMRGTRYAVRIYIYIFS